MCIKLGELIGGRVLCEAFDDLALDYTARIEHLLRFERAWLRDEGATARQQCYEAILR